MVGPCHGLKRLVRRSRHHIHHGIPRTCGTPWSVPCPGHLPEGTEGEVQLGESVAGGSLCRRAAPVRTVGRSHPLWLLLLHPGGSPKSTTSNDPACRLTNMPGSNFRWSILLVLGIQATNISPPASASSRGSTTKKK